MKIFITIIAFGFLFFNTLVEFFDQNDFQFKICEFDSILEKTISARK